MTVQKNIIMRMRMRMMDIRMSIFIRRSILNIVLIHTSILNTELIRTSILSIVLIRTSIINLIEVIIMMTFYFQYH